MQVQIGQGKLDSDNIAPGWFTLFEQKFDQNIDSIKYEIGQIKTENGKTNATVNAHSAKISQINGDIKRIEQEKTKS